MSYDPKLQLNPDQDLNKTRIVNNNLIQSQMLRNQKKAWRISMHLVRELEKGLTIIIKYLGH